VLINEYCSRYERPGNKYTTTAKDANKLLLTGALKIRAACISWTTFRSVYSFRIITESIKSIEDLEATIYSFVYSVQEYVCIRHPSKSNFFYEKGMGHSRTLRNGFLQ